MAVGGAIAFAQGPSLAIAIVSIGLLLAYTVVPPVWVGRSPDEGMVAKAQCILLFALLRQRAGTYAHAAVAGALIGLATAISLVTARGARRRSLRRGGLLGDVYRARSW